MCYSAADIVIARAGAGTLFELSFFNKKTFLIPLEIKSTQHQLDNAQAMVNLKPKLFKLFRQKTVEADPTNFFSNIISIVKRDSTKKIGSESKPTNLDLSHTLSQ